MTKRYQTTYTLRFAEYRLKFNLFLSFIIVWYRPGIGKRLSRSPSGCGMALQHQLLIDQDKTKFTLFSTKQQPGKLVNPTESILGKTLTPDKVCKDLGVYLQSSLTFVTHIDPCPRLFLLCVKLIEYGISMIYPYFSLFYIHSFLVNFFIVRQYGLAQLNRTCKSFRNLDLFRPYSHWFKEVWPYFASPKRSWLVTCQGSSYCRVL